VVLLSVVGYIEGGGLLGATELVIDAFLTKGNFLWPMLCFFHLPVYILWVHLLLYPTVAGEKTKVA